METEKVTLEKLMASYGSVSDSIKSSLEKELHNIELNDKESQKIVEREQAGDESDTKETEGASTEPPKVNTY